MRPWNFLILLISCLMGRKRRKNTQVFDFARPRFGAGSYVRAFRRRGIETNYNRDRLREGGHGWGCGWAGRAYIPLCLSAHLRFRIGKVRPVLTCAPSLLPVPSPSLKRGNLCECRSQGFLPLNRGEGCSSFSLLQRRSVLLSSLGPLSSCWLRDR